MQNKKLIYGFHSILSVIRSNPSLIKELFLDDSRNDGRMQQLIKAAEEREIKFHLYSKSRLDQLLPKTKHQGVLASVSQQAEKFFTLEDIVEKDHKAEPIMGIVISKSHESRVNLLIPLPSEPIMIAIGPLRSAL